MSYLSETMMNAAIAVDSSRLVGRKAWLDDVHAAYVASSASYVTLATFKAALASDPDCRMLMARCDLPQCHLDRIEQSEVKYMHATFNFVKL